MLRILVVLENRDEGAWLVKKAVKLAHAYGASLHFYKHSYSSSVDDFDRFFGFDNLEDMKQQMLQDDTNWVQEFVAAQNLEGVDSTCAATWNRRLYQGVLAEVENSHCDLILKAANVHNRLYEIVHTPDDWSLMREANCPVMLVRGPSQKSSEAQVPADRQPVMAAVNPLEDGAAHRELHARVLKQASELAKGLQTGLIVVAAVPMFNYNTPYFVGVAGQYPNLQESMRSSAKERLDAMLQEHAVETDRVIIEDGSAEFIIERICDESRAQFLVIGTVANKGLAGAFLGNTAERILHHVNRDLLVVQ